MSYKAVYFDLDGTLLDSLDDLADSMNLTLESLGFDGHKPAAYRQFIGDGVETLVRRALPINQRHEDIVRSALESMRTIYRKRWNRKTQLYPGISELLQELVEQKVILAILSNKPNDFVTQMVSHFFQSYPFDMALGAQSTLPKKPDPTAASHIAQTLGIPPSNWIFVGDSGSDMQTAKRAQMTAVGVLWGFRSAEELRSAGADHLIKHPHELLLLL